MAFAKAHQIPVAETQAGKSAIVSSERLNVGGIGVTGNSVANTLAKEADLIIGIGTRFTDFTTGSKSLVGQTPLIAINASPFHAQKLDAIPVIADAKLAIKKLGQLLEGYTAQHEQLDIYKGQWEQELQRLKNQTYQIGGQLEIAGQLDEQVPDYIDTLQTTMTQTSAFMLINEKVEKDAIVVGAAGSLPGDMQRLWKTNAPNTYHMEYGYSCMGYEVAAALGAKISSPEQEVYAMVGDGSFQMLHSEFVTSLQEQKKSIFYCLIMPGLAVLTICKWVMVCRAIKQSFATVKEMIIKGLLWRLIMQKLQKAMGLKRLRYTRWNSWRVQ